MVAQAVLNASSPTPDPPVLAFLRSTSWVRSLASAAVLKAGEHAAGTFLIKILLTAFGS